MSQESDPASRPAAQWQAPDRLTLDRTEVTGKYDWRCFQNTDALASKPKKKVACATLFRIGRHNWIRTNDPHHVKVVL